MSRRQVQQCNHELTKGDGGADAGDGGGGDDGAASHAARAAVPFPVGTLFSTGRSTYLEVTHIHGGDDDDDREYRYLNGRWKGQTYTVSVDDMSASNILQDRDKAKLHAAAGHIRRCSKTPH